MNLSEKTRNQAMAMQKGIPETANRFSAYRRRGSSTQRRKAAKAQRGFQRGGGIMAAKAKTHKRDPGNRELAKRLRENSCNWCLILGLTVGGNFCEDGRHTRQESVVRELSLFSEFDAGPRRGSTSATSNKDKTGKDDPRRLCSRNAFEHGVSAWRIGNQFALSNFVLIPI
jgi:hypothetical protein